MKRIDSQARVFNQARMSSSRFPGKVLAPLEQRPVLQWVVDGVSSVVERDQIVVATSGAASDDELEDVVRGLGVNIFRGTLDNVVLRFQECLLAFPCPWFFRISADSPFINASVLPMLLERCADDLDLVTNVFPRTFPRGHSAELIRSEIFAAFNAEDLTAEQQEHVTQVYYDNPQRFRIVNVESEDVSLAKLNYCVDTPEDLRRLERDVAQGKLFLPGFGFRHG